MSELSIQGTLKEFLPLKSGESKNGGEWQSQDFIVSNNDGYEGAEQLFCFNVFGEDKIEKLKQYNKEGDQVTVKFNIRTNEYNGNYYTKLAAWRVEKAEGEATPQASSTSEADSDLPW